MEEAGPRLTLTQRRNIQAVGLVTTQHAEALAHEYERLVTYLVQQELQMIAQQEHPGRLLRPADRQMIRQATQETLDRIVAEIQDKLTLDSVAEALDEAHLPSELC